MLHIGVTPNWSLCWYTIREHQSHTGLERSWGKDGLFLPSEHLIALNVYMLKFRDVINIMSIYENII